MGGGPCEGGWRGLFSRIPLHRTTCGPPPPEIRGRIWCLVRPHPLPGDPGLQHLRIADVLRAGAGEDGAVDEDEVARTALVEAAEPVVGEAGIGRAAGEGGER